MEEFDLKDFDKVYAERIAHKIEPFEKERQSIVFKRRKITTLSFFTLFFMSIVFYVKIEDFFSAFIISLMITAFVFVLPSFSVMEAIKDYKKKY